MMKMTVAAAPPPSGFSRYHDGQADQVPCATAKVRGGDMVRLANASGCGEDGADLACLASHPRRHTLDLLTHTIYYTRW